jgi:hypothetical protein
MHIYIKSNQGDFVEHDYEALNKLLSDSDNSSILGFMINNQGIGAHYLFEKNSATNELKAYYVSKFDGKYKYSLDYYQLTSTGKTKYVRTSQPTRWTTLDTELNIGDCFFSEKERNDLRDKAREDCITEIIGYSPYDENSTRLLLNVHDNTWDILEVFRALPQSNKDLLTDKIYAQIFSPQNRFILPTLIKSFQYFSQANITLNEEDILCLFKCEESVLNTLTQTNSLTRENWDEVKKLPKPYAMAYALGVLNNNHILDENTRAFLRGYIKSQDATNLHTIAHIMVYLHKQERLNSDNLSFLTQYPTDSLNSLSQCMALYQDKKINEPIWDILKKGSDLNQTHQLLERSNEYSLPYPKTYTLLYQQGTSPLESARVLLNDYTKNNSGFLLFLHGHWNRHHVLEVAALVKKIDQKQIEDIGTLFDELSKINLINPEKGSLARRISFILKQIAPQEELKDEHAPISLSF